jgi:hypothetical protein
VCAVVVALGALFVFGPFLASRRQWRTSVSDATAASALFTTTAFVLPDHDRACMGSVAVTPASAVAAFQIQSSTQGENEGLPLEVVLSAPGYRTATSMLATAGFTGRLDFQITPPPRGVIATVCVINRGRIPVSLLGTAAARTASRSVLTVNGKRTPGNLTLAFYERHLRRRVMHVGSVFEHISNLTDRLIPVWLVWILIISAFLAVPAGIVAALHRGLREDESAAEA